MRDLKKQGFALLLVVWVLALLSLMAIGFTGHVRTGSSVLSTATGQYQVKALSEAALQRGLHALFNPGRTKSWKLDGQPYEFAYAGARLFFSIQSEGGKIDLNSASDDLLFGLFQHVLQGREDITAGELLDQLRDWQDEDDLSRLQGAEFNDYELEDMGYGPSNLPLRSVSEFQQLKSVDQEIARRILPFVTVYSYKTTINPAYAGEGVLKALPGVRQSDVDDYLEARQQLDLIDMTEEAPIFVGEPEYLDEEIVTVYTMTGRAVMPSGQSHERKLVVWLAGNDRSMSPSGQLPYWILEAGE